MYKYPLPPPRLRSLLFVPGNRPDRIQKAWVCAADAIIVDLEDGVPELQKPEARRQVRHVFNRTPEIGPLLLLRINPVSTPYWKEDLDVVLSPEVRGIVVPKWHSQDEIREIESFLKTQESRRGIEPGATGLFLLVETALGLLQVSKLDQKSPRLAALLFGAEDFCLDMGVSRLAAGAVAHARHHLAVCARAYNCLAIDTIYGRLNDESGLLRDSEAAKSAGFSGKLAIHPQQVQIINTVFSAKNDELNEARRIVEAFRVAEASGKGTTVVNGTMIDRPIVERARRLLRSSEKSE
jgi:citrate lyase subunit beta / citryl-CoA lyase